MSEPCALSIDVGSSSVRAALYDAHADIVGGTFAQIEIDLARHHGGIAQLDALELRQSVEFVIDSVLAADAGRGRQIAVVGMTTFWHSLLALGKANQPLTPVLTWADTRSARQARELGDVIDKEATRHRTGCPVHPSYLPAKIAWLREHHPATMSETVWLGSFAEYCCRVWLDTPMVSVSMASGSGLFNHHTGEWDDTVLEALALTPGMLGSIAPDPEMLPPVGGDWSERWPRLRNIPWRAPIGDGAASNVGAGCHRSDLLALMVGTSGALRRCEEAPKRQQVPDGLWRYRLDRVRTLTGGALSDAGNAYAWLRATLQLPSEDECEAALAARLPGQHGLVVLPFWSGERSPGWVGDATAMVAGLTMSTTPFDIYHAVIEAVSYRFATIYDALAMEGDTLVATGGGLRASPAWMQILADCVGVPVVESSVAESSMRGVAIIALRDAGVAYASGLPDGPTGRQFEPRGGYVQMHLEERARQQKLYEREVGGEGSRLLARQTR